MTSNLHVVVLNSIQKIIFTFFEVHLQMRVAPATVSLAIIAEDFAIDVINRLVGVIPENLDLLDSVTDNTNPLFGV